MSETFLEKILAVTREKVAARRSAVDFIRLQEAARSIRSQRGVHLLSKAMSRPDGINIIAEIKRASPSKGTINDAIDVAETARKYDVGRAAAISVLTEEQFFKGSLDDLKTVRNATDLPILRKDFIVDEFQIYETSAAGADAILLIVAALTPEDLIEFRTRAQELGLDALVEVHTLNELQIASEIGADLIGVNNRDLRTFDVSLDVSRELVGHRPDGALMIAESGISSREQITELKALGFDGFLIGETLMRAGDLKQTMEALV
jgi:indole-3-glycerol phosphate synthase